MGLFKGKTKCFDDAIHLAHTNMNLNRYYINKASVYSKFLCLLISIVKLSHDEWYFMLWPSYQPSLIWEILSLNKLVFPIRKASFINPCPEQATFQSLEWNIMNVMNKLYDPTLWIGFKWVRATEPLRGDSLLYTTFIVVIFY